MKEENKKKIKKLKAYIILLGICVVLCFTTAIVSVSIYVREKNYAEKESIPSSGLSRSIFDYQNSEYESSEEREMRYYIANGHYAYDMDESQKADIGNSSFFKVTENINIGVTFLKGEQSMNNLIAALSTDVEKAFGITSLKYKDSMDGFRNGFASTYCVLNSTDNKDLKMLAYCLKIDEGYIVISGFSTEVSYNDVCTQCLKLYDSLHIPEEWYNNNQEETSEMFVPMDATTEAQIRE